MFIHGNTQSKLKLRARLSYHRWQKTERDVFEKYQNILAEDNLAIYVIYVEKMKMKFFLQIFFKKSGN